jgi:transcription elongation factor Elf1
MSTPRRPGNFVQYAQLTFGSVRGIIHTESEVSEMYIKHFICPYCGKELLNQNEFVDCDNENEFWCDNCDITFIEEDGEIVEE